MRSADEQTARKRWQRQYIVRQSQVFAEIEHEVFGSDYGATSWTDRAEAEAFARFLRLGPNTRALEVGAGSGWPGVYLSALTGCDLTLIDVPEEGLHRASSRASADGIGNRCRAIVADGSQLPLRDRQFEAIYHCDVLCWLAAKSSVLSACRRVATKSARMAFAVITFAPKLTAAERELAKAGAPAFTETSEAYPELLDGSGWEIDDQTDVTAAFFDLCRRELTAFEARSDRLRELLGKSDFNERLTLRLSKVAGIEAGVIRREIYKVHPVSDPSGRDPQHKS